MLTHARIQKFSPVGVQVYLKYINTLTMCFLLFFFALVFFKIPNLFHRSPMLTSKENYHFPRFQVGSNFFQFGGGGRPLLIPYRNQYNLWFSRGSGPHFVVSRGQSLLLNLHLHLTDAPANLRMLTNVPEVTQHAEKSHDIVQSRQREKCYYIFTFSCSLFGYYIAVCIIMSLRYSRRKWTL